MTSTGKKMKFAWVLLVGAAALANAGPVARDTCAPICDIAQTKLFFEPGKTFVYEYEGQTLTTIEGAMEEVSGLNVKTTARIHATTPCEMTLELRGTELSHMVPNDATKTTPSPVGGAFKDALEANAIRFGINNGRVERVCGGAKDAAWVLNIKKAIISALQNNMADLKTEMTIRESDIVGTCDTVYTPAADGSIVKTKNLLGCIDREHLNTMVQHAHYMVPSDIQGVPFLKSEHTCKQTITEGKIAEVTCMESHVVRAFSNGEAGAATNLKMKMTLKEVVAEKKTAGMIAFTSPITFDMTKTEREIQDAVAFVKSAMTEICAADHAEDKSPERFAKLIKNVQAMDTATLTKLHQELKAARICRLGEKTLHDVLPLAGSTASVSLMKDILLSGEIDGVEKDMWKSALAFIPNPNKEMIAHVTPLLAIPDRKIYLSTSTMVRNFCMHRADCTNVKEVQDFIKVLEAHIGNDCSGPVDEVLMSLKAIGNAGVTLTGRITLIKCVKNEKNPMDIKLAALEAFRHMELSTAKPALIEMYKDMELDPEIRIGAFVTLMRNPCKMCIDAVQATMAKERVLQVGSFVMSYMQNARRSDNPMKKDINEILRMFDEAKIKRDWNLERMKYSRAYEASYFSSYLNAGIDAESQVIFSQAGFLPRQVKTDLNINLFGRSIDLLEIGARMEGLENLLEHYFGPNGPLAETGVGRTKRAAINTKTVEKIDGEVKSQTPLKETRGLMYFKMFGSELGYANFDLETILKKKDEMNVFRLLKSIAQNHEQEYTQNFQLMDLTYTIPTILGLPLKLDLNAHGTMHLKVGGKIDIVKFMQPPRNLDINGHIKPSAAIEVRTEMGIDAFLTHTGIKMVSNVHTSTSIEGKVMLKDGKIFKVHYAVPRTEQEIMHLDTKFFVKHHDTEREQRMITQDAIAMEKCTGETLAKVTGLEMCGEIRLPNAAMIKTAPHFPLTGPVNMRLAIMKRDPKLTSFDFEASRTSAEGVETLKLIIDTPKSEINRELSTIVTLNTNTKNLAIDVKSPWKKVAASALMVNNADLKKIQAKVVVDDVREYSATATALIQHEGAVMKIIPEFNVNMNGEMPVKMGGSITIEQGAKITADLKVEKLTTKPITLIGTLEQVIGNGQLRLNHDITFTSPLVTLGTKGFVEKKAVKFAVRSENMFKFRDGAEHKMVLDSKIHSETKRDVQMLNLNSNLALSDFPEHNMGIAVELKKTPTNTKFNVEATFKKNLKPVKFLNDWTLKLTAPLEIALKSELVLPVVTISMDHKISQTSEKEFNLFSLTKWAEKEAKADFTLVIGEAPELRGFLVAPIMPRVDLLIKPVIAENKVDINTEMKYREHVHKFVFTAKRERALVIIHSHIVLDADKYEINVRGRALNNLMEINADAKWKNQVFILNWNAAIQKAAVKVHTDITAMGMKAEFNLNGEMTGEAIKAQIDAALGEKKVQANLDYFRKDWTMRVLANVAGLTHLTDKLESASIKIHNELNSGELSSLIEAKVDQKALLVVAVKGKVTEDTINGNARITALTTTLAGDIMLTKKGGYSAIVNVELPERIVGVEVMYSGAMAEGTAGLKINTNKNIEDSSFEYGLKWSTAAPRDRTQFKGELTIKSPMYLFPLPIKMTALFSRDILDTFITDLVIDYGFKFEFKGIHKVMPIGIETNVMINTPIEGHEKMTGELIATLADNKLNFKLAGAHNKKAIEMVLTGKATAAQQEVMFAFKTPFKGMEMITASIKNKLNHMNIDASAELKWGLNKKVAIVFMNQANDLADIKGKLTIVTPIEKYETTLFEYGLTTKGDTRNMLVRFTWARNQVVEFTAVHSFKPDMKLGFVLESVLKVPTIEDLKFNVDFSYLPMKLIDLQLTGMLGQKTIVLTGKASRKDTGIDAAITIKTPWTPEGMGAVFVFADPNQGKNLDATLTLTLDAKKIIKLTAYVKKENWNKAEGRMEFTSFFSDKVAADFGWHVSESDGILKNNLAIEYLPGKKITYDFELLRKGTDMDMTIKTTTPLDPLRLVKYSVKSTGGLDNLNTHVEGQFNDMVVATDFVAKILSRKDFEITLTTTAPIRNYEKTSFALMYKESAKITAKASLLLKGETWTVDCLAKIMSPMDFEITFTATTPIKTFEKTSLAILLKDATAKATLLLKGETWTVDCLAKIMSPMDFEITFTATTPIKTFEKTAFAILLKDATAKASLLFKGETWTVDCLAKIMKPRRFHVIYDITFTVTTPIKTFEKTSLAILFNNPDTFNTLPHGPATAKVTLLLREKTWSLEWKHDWPNPDLIETSLTLSTPLANWEKTVIAFSRNINYKPETVETAKFTLLLNGKTWAIEGIDHGNYARWEDFSFIVTLNTPLKNLEVVTMKMSNKGGLEDMVAKLTLITPPIKETPVDLEIAAKFIKFTDMDAKLTLKGALAEPLSIQMSNRGENLKPLITIVSVTLGPKVYTLTSTLNFEAITSMDGSLVLTTPIEKYERVGLTWANKIAAGKKDAKLIVEFQTDQRITLEGHILRKEDKFETRFTVTTPFPALDKAAFALDITGILTNFQCVISLALPKLRTTEIHFSNMLDLSNGIMHRGSFRMDCLFFSTVSVETALDVKISDIKYVKFDTKFGYGLKKGHYTLITKLSKEKFELETSLETDWTEAKSAALMLMLVKNTEHIIVSTALKWNKVEVISLTYKHIPHTTGMECILALKQKLVSEIPDVWDCTLNVEMTMAKSLIKFTTLANKTPFTSFDFTHTYKRTELTAKVAFAFKTFKAESNLLIRKPTETLLIKIDASMGENKILDFITSHEMTAEKIHALKIKAVFEGKTLLDYSLKIKPHMEDVVVAFEESGHNLFGLRANIIEQKLEAHITWQDSPLIDLKTEFNQSPLTFAAELKFKGKPLFVTRTVIELKAHSLELHLNWQNAPLIDLKAEFRPTPYTLAIELKYEGKMLLTTRNILDVQAKSFNIMVNIDPLLEMVIVNPGSWILMVEGNVALNNGLTVFTMDSKLADKVVALKTEFRREPYTLAIELKYGNKMILKTRNIIEVNNVGALITMDWEVADKVVALKTEFRQEPYTLAIELKYENKMILVTKNIVDLKARTISLMLNVDPLLRMFIETPESWILSVEGSVAKRRDATTFVLDMKKADKMIHIELMTKQAGKLSWKSIFATADLKIAAKNFANNMELSLVTEIKKNQDYLKTSIVTAINQVEYFRHIIECKMANEKKELSTSIFFLPLRVNAAIAGEVTVAELMAYKLQIIGNKDNEKDTTVIVSGTFTMRPSNFMFDIKTVLPTRTLVLKIKNVLANGILEHLVSFSWEDGKSTGYSFTLADRSKSNAMIYSINGEFTHPIRTVKYDAKAEISTRKCLLALNIMPDTTLPERKTYFFINIANESNGEMINLKTDATFAHPALETPLKMDVTLTLNRGKILAASSVTIEYSKIERKRITFSFRVVKESTAADNIHYMLVTEVKQPANFVDIRVNADIKRSATGILDLLTRVSYLTSKRETKTVTFSTIANIMDPKIELRLVTPTADRKIIASLLNKVSAEGRHVRFVLTHEDVAAKIVTPILDVELDEPSHAFRIKLTNLLNVEAGIHDKYMVRLTVIAKERKILLLKTNFKDATHMLINTRFEWDPVLLETIKTEVPPVIAKAAERLAATWEPIVKVVLEDIQTKMEALNEIGWKDIEPLFEAWRKFVIALDKDMAIAIEGLKQMWKDNEFYLRDAGEVILKSWNKFMIKYAEFETKLWINTEEFIEYLEINHQELMATLRSLEKEVKTYAIFLTTEFIRIRGEIELKFEKVRPHVEAVVRKNIEVAQRMIEEFIRETEPIVKELVAKTMKTIGEIRANIIPFIAKTKEQITALKIEMEKTWEPLRVKLVQMLAELRAKMEEIKSSGVANALIELQQNMEAQYATTTAAIVEWLREMNTKYEALIKEWETIPQVAELKESIAIFREKLVWAWKYLDVEGEAVRLIEEIKMRIARFWRIIEDNKSTVLIYDTKAGILDFDIEIPIALKELARLPKIDDLLARLDIIRRELVANAPKIGWLPMDYYYYWMPRDMTLPPFTATGMVAGNQHFFTFDGSFIEFAGDCSYVLARDFDDGKFTVIANYRRTREGPKRTSLSVMAGANTIEVFNDFKTVIDKDRVELPVELPEATVKRAGVDQVIISSKKGMTVTCNMNTEICTVAISGWYFGKTGGLLGTYNYEPSDDMTNPMGKRIDDIERFANTWEVAKTCSDKHNYAKSFHRIENIKSTVAYEVCAALFMAEGSALRPAFRNVDPTPYMNMCINDAFEFQHRPEDYTMMRKKACTAVAAYMEEARLRGIMLEAPKDCLRCSSVAGTELLAGETEMVTKPIEGVDTVVIVEENICNKNKRKDLLGLISTLQAAYRKQGLKDNLFGLAAFGGPGVHKEPHFHTIEGELMNTDRKFVRGVRSLDFAEETPLNFVEGAIEFAARNYAWRAGYKRNIIVVSCSQCMDRQPPHTDLRTVIAETKVTVHMLRDLELAFRGGKRAANVLGFDRTGVFTTKHTSAATLEGDAALLAQLAVPKEHCLPIVMDTEGTFFSINSWTAGRVREQKKLMEVVSKRVAVASETEPCQICECKATNPFTMTTSVVCKPCKK